MKRAGVLTGVPTELLADSEVPREKALNALCPRGGRPTLLDRNPPSGGLLEAMCPGGDLRGGRELQA